jgi:hypothetical protein
MSEFFFHVMQGERHAAVLRMKNDGAYEVFAPSHKVLTAWPRYVAIAPHLAEWFGQDIRQEAVEHYEEEIAPHLALWLKRAAGRELRDPARNIVKPGDDRYPRALAQALTGNGLLRLWAYVTPVTLLVSFRQVATAYGREPTSAFRQELESQGLRFMQSDTQQYETSMEMVTRQLGQAVADRVLLYPRHIADFLGTAVGSASEIARAKNIALAREDTTVVTWGKLRRVKRTGPRKFEMSVNGNGGHE